MTKPTRIIRTEHERWTILNALADYKRNCLKDAQEFKSAPQLERSYLHSAEEAQRLYERIEDVDI